MAVSGCLCLLLPFCRCCSVLLLVLLDVTVCFCWFYGGGCGGGVIIGNRTTIWCCYKGLRKGVLFWWVGCCLVGDRAAAAKSYHGFRLHVSPPPPLLHRTPAVLSKCCVQCFRFYLCSDGGTAYNKKQARR